MPPEENFDLTKVFAAGQSGAADARTQAEQGNAGRQIGRYRLLQKIGEGGMGEVWLAEQKDPIRRRVAVKLIKAGMDSSEVVARFESERQLLALMDHPAIAKVLDAGTTPEAAPYFVMEYVAGVPITTYCDDHKLNTRERMQLFMRICEAVQHAHQKAIIHRDLKPSNILVAEVDGRAMPKVIDFGVAKALSQQVIADTLFTRIGSLIGTLEYMSPEQALSSGLEVDTRTDVYTLGVILYELLAGGLPRDLRTISFDEFLRRLRHDDPQKPSTAISTHDPATSTELARKRRTVPRSLAKEIRGDLDNIVLKAMHREPARRYRSVEQMSEDILRHLENRPVIARPDTIGYRFSRFATRNRWGLATAVAVLLSLTIGTVVSVHQANVARQRFEQVRKLAGRFIALNDEVARLPGSTAVREKLVATALDYLGKLAQSAGNDASLLDELGQAYAKISFAQGSAGDPSLGKTESAIASLRKAVEFESKAAAIDPVYFPKVASLESSLAYVAMVDGRLPEARKHLEAAAALLSRLRAQKPADLNLLRLSAGVNMYKGDLAGSEGHARDGLRDYQQARQMMEDYCRISPGKTAQYQLHMVSVTEAESLAENGRYNEALARVHQSQPVIEGLLAAEPLNPRYIRQKMAAANCESKIYDGEGGQNLGKPAEAAAAGRRYLALAQKLVDGDPHNASARLSLAIASFQLSYPIGKFDPAESLRLAQTAIHILNEDLARSPKNYLVRSRLARAFRYSSYAYVRNSQPYQARSALEKAIDIQRQLLIETPSNTGEREQLELSQQALSNLN